MNKSAAGKLSSFTGSPHGVRSRQKFCEIRAARFARSTTSHPAGSRHGGSPLAQSSGDKLICSQLVSGLFKQSEM